MANDFVPGDTVRIKSGGPLMTVEQVADEYGKPTVFCVWFDEKNNEKRGRYPPATIEKVEPKASGGGGERGGRGGGGSGSWMGN